MLLDTFYFTRYLWRMPDQPTTDGSRTLRTWLDNHDLSVSAFCREHELDRIMVQRALKGDRRRISVDFALRIERATSGAVPMALWSSDTLATGTEG